jgi:multiple sugar transport system substrate-binding protein
MDRFVTASYAHAEGLMDLDNFIKRDGIKSSDYFPACWNECIYKGKIWSIPHHTDVRVLYYRTDDFKEAGLDPNKPPKTWDEAFEYAKKLTVKKGNILERIGFVPDLGNTYLHMYAYGNGGRFMRNGKITCNEPAVVQALQYIVKVNDWYGRDNIMSAQGGFGQREMDPFIMGKLSMWIDGDWYLGILKRFGPHVKFKIAPPPVPKGKKPSTWSGGWALAIPNGSKNTNEAWELIKHLTSFESQISYATQAFRIPANKKAAQNKFFKTNKYYKVFLDMMKYTKYRPVTPISLYYWDKIREALGFSVDHKKSPKQALDDSAAEVKEYYKQYQD